MHYIWYILWPTLNFNSKMLQNFSLIFDFNLLEWRVVKTHASDFWLRFYFLGYWPILHFVSFEIGTKNRKSSITKKPHIFWGIRGTVLLNGYFLKRTPLLKELHQKMFELELEHCTLTENTLRRLIVCHWYCNFNPPPRLNDICGMCDVSAKMSSFNLFFVWKLWYFLKCIDKLYVKNFM